MQIFPHFLRFSSDLHEFGAARKWISTNTYHICCPMWAKFGVTGGSFLYCMMYLFWLIR
jgi:hypothetical protein